MQSRARCDKIKTFEEIGAIVRALRALPKPPTIVTTNGSFDILHAGHVKSLETAKAFGDVLIVGLNSDSSIKQYKSPLRPVIPQQDRANMLAALEVVDYVVIFDDTTPNRLLGIIQPDVHVKSKSGYTGVERAAVEGHGGRIELMDDIPGLSTTRIIARILEIAKQEAGQAQKG